MLIKRYVLIFSLALISSAGMQYIQSNTEDGMTVSEGFLDYERGVQDYLDCAREPGFSSL